jgi:AraC-like DNA-binding protein
MMQLEPYSIRSESDYALGMTDLRELPSRPVASGSNLMLICLDGEAELEMLGRPWRLKRGDIVIADREMQLRVVSAGEGVEAFYMLMSEQFCNEVYKHLSASLCDMSYQYSVWHAGRAQMPQLTAWVKQILWLDANTAGPQRSRLMRNGVESLLLVCDYEAERLLARLPKRVMQRDWELAVRFGQLLMLHARREHTVNFYAEQLCITPYYLGTVTRHTLNASPKALIDREIIRQLKLLLTTTDMSLKEIAEEMHFDDVSYMCKFFNRHAGMSMREYRGK